MHQADPTQTSQQDERDIEPALSPPPGLSPACLENGDVFLLLDALSNFVVGCDTFALTNSTDGNLLGIRDLPAGVHFVWVSGTSALSRCGYWFLTKLPGEVRVKQWDRYNEVLGDATSHLEARYHRESIDRIYPRLMPYQLRSQTPLSTTALPSQPNSTSCRNSTPEPDVATSDTLIWYHLTSSINENLLSRVTGKEGIGEWLVDTSDTAKGEVQFPRGGQLSKTVVGSELSFLFPLGDVDIRLLNLADRDHAAADTYKQDDGVPDTTAEIINLLDRSPADCSITEDDIVGELQFAFLTGMHLSNLSCVDQWWHLVLKVVLRAHRLAVARPALCRALLRTLHAQLVYNDRYIVGGLPDAAGSALSRRGVAKTIGNDGEGGGVSILDMMPRNRVRLRAALIEYKRRLDAVLLGLGPGITREQRAVGHAFVELEAWFWKHGWDLRSDSAGGGEDDGSSDEDGGAGLGDEVESSTPRKAYRGGLDDDDNDDDDYLPVVVELDDKGREVGLVSWSD